MSYVVRVVRDHSLGILP